MSSLVIRGNTLFDLESLTEHYLDIWQYQRNLSPKTLKAYRIDLRQFTDFMKMTDGELNKINLSDYVTHLHKNYKPRTAKRKVACIKSFCSCLEQDEIIEKNPFSKIRTKFQEPFCLPKTIPLDEIQEIFTAAYSDLKNSKKSSFEHEKCIRDIAVLELLFATGMRVSELCSLKTEDVNLSDHYIIINGKGSKERVVHIGNKSVITALRMYKSAFCGKIPESGCFFINRLNNRLSEQSVRTMIVKYTEKADISRHITPHMFRHSFATLLLEEDVDIRYIQQVLGHSSIVTTQIYTHVTSKKQKHILTEKHPRNRIVICED
ncbi:tyrosine-type recombinase/integrase [Candidatus Methanomassiliicoccus intestinalis]|uniref:Tyrosine recombinase XerA n=1 Tax=Methanomassiliicoccus intestinalis (strain Issoire-Mx1) TaxID=1295009 RepID=R9T814_METII|nr:tyrosine-type recombinase/integrase [Candidatus Methanomassiliicoccus intestinalis]AGN25488.1 tyrosine recombinase Xer [Candidatus Methanomassiliicoccus intestinalis Issoire-Mx1]